MVGAGVLGRRAARLWHQRHGSAKAGYSCRFEGLGLRVQGLEKEKKFGNNIYFADREYGN